MHSSRMRTACSLSYGRRGSLYGGRGSGGVLCPGGFLSRGGLCPGVPVQQGLGGLSGGSLSGGLSGGLCLGGLCLGDLCLDCRTMNDKVMA